MEHQVEKQLNNQTQDRNLQTGHQHNKTHQTTNKCIQNSIKLTQITPFFELICSRFLMGFEGFSHYRVGNKNRMCFSIKTLRFVIEVCACFERNKERL